MNGRKSNRRHAQERRRRRQREKDLKAPHDGGGPTMSAEEVRTRLRRAEARLAELEGIKSGIHYEGGLRTLESDKRYLADRIVTLRQDLSRTEG